MVTLLFTNLFPNSESPNYGIFVYHRAVQLQRFHAHSVHIVAPVPYFPKWLPIPKRFHSWPRIAHWIRMSRIPTRELYGTFTVYHPRYLLLPGISAPLHGLLMFFGAFLCSLRLHRQARFDCIDAHFAYPDGFAAVLIGKLLRRPVIITAHGTDLNLYTDRALLRPLIRWTLNQAERIICVSTTLMTIVLSLKIPKEKVAVIRNGVDLKCFHHVDKDEARFALGLPSRNPIVLSVGQLIFRKGHQFLIDAVARLRSKFPGLRVFIIGEGALRTSLEKRVSDLGLERHVCFIGAIRNEELFHWYSAADVTCLTSSREGFPCVLLESFACGTPVVATQIEGTREVVGSRDLGLLVEQNASAIAEGLTEALRASWPRLPFAAYVRDLTWTKIGNAINEILVSSAHTSGRLNSLALKVNTL